MSVKQKHREKNATYFVTFTCYNWLPLFQITNFYDAIYNWFSLLEKSGNRICGFTIMPNHLHMLLFVHQDSKDLDYLIGQGKRFMAYEIIKRLKEMQREDILTTLAEGRNAKETKEGKLHRVFEESFDAKWCNSDKLILQKLAYMHSNPVKAGLAGNS